MKKWLLWGTPLLILISVAATLRLVVQEGLEIWSLAQIQAEVSTQTPVDMACDGLELSWVPLKVSLRNVRVRAKPNADLGFEMARTQLIEARVDVLQLFAGKVGLSVALLEGLKLDLNIDPFLRDSGPVPEIDWEQIFKFADVIPVRTFALLDAQIRLRSKKLDFETEINGLAARLQRSTGKISLEAQTRNSSLRFKEFHSPWTLGIQTFATPQAIEISQFHVTTPKQSLEVSGVVTDTRQLLKAPQARLQVLMRANLGEIMTALPASLKLPHLEGEVEFESTLEVRGQKLPVGNFRLLTRDVIVHKSEVGGIETSGSFDGRILSLAQVKLSHSAGSGLVQDLRAELGEDQSFDSLQVKGKLSTQDLSLFRLLKGVGVGEIPVELLIAGELDCGGTLLPRPSVVCVGSAKGQDLDVHLEEQNKKGIKILPIVKLKDFSAEGGVQITHEAVTYQAKAKVGEDTGSSSGMISYSKGFLINFETPAVHLEHAGSIAGLGIEGLAAISGSTSGDSDAATFEMKAKGSGIYFEDFFLGDAETQVRYQKGKLSFGKIAGKINQSPYRAEVEANLRNQRIKVSGSSSQLRIEDLFAVFPRKFTLPVPMIGTASASVELEGPFHLGKLSYSLRAKVPYLDAGGEIFKDGDIEIRSVNGEVRTEKAHFRKGSQNMVIKGAGHPNGDVDINIVGNQLLLEESENIMQMAANISGFMDLGIQIRGFILDPEVAIQAQLGQMIIEDQEFPPSAASVQLTRKRIEGSVRLFAGRLFGDFIWPLQEDQAFSVKLQASDWNFATLATLIGGGNLLSEYESSITGDLSIGSERGGLWKASGQGTIQSFLLRRGNQILKNVKPMRLVMNQGSSSLENFRVEGGKDSIDVSAQQFSKEQLRMKIDGDLSLRILQIFVPFLEELGGNGRINAVVSGSLSKPEILGSAHLTDGFARFRGFPHALERVSADVQFSASRILISDIKGSLAGGTVEGDGSILLVGPRNLPVNIRAQATGVSLNVPDKIQTSGDIDLTFGGNWFPYTLAGTYRVFGGLYSKELDDQTGLQQVQQSSYLPKLMRQSAFEPVLLDLQVDLVRPLQLKNSMIEGQATGNLQIRGSPRSPGILGMINVASGTKVTVREKIFEVNSATLKFLDPKEIDPELFVSARSRVNEYDINLLVQGHSKAPLIRMSSIPPLPESDIVSLLALGVTSRKLEERVQSREQESSTSYEIGTAIIQNNPLTKSLQKSLGFNLQFSSGYDDTKNIAVQKITLSRQISDRVNAAVSQSRGTQNSTEAKVQYHFNPSLSAVGTWEGRERVEGASGDNIDNRSESIFGIDLEFKKEFK